MVYQTVDFCQVKVIISDYFQQSYILPNQIGAPNSNIMMPQQQSYWGPQAVMPNTGSTNSFQLKWLLGTNVSRCYSCSGVIPNPPQDVPDDLVIVYRDLRRYRDRQTGQLQCTGAPQNVHFHLRFACVRARYPHFTGSLLIVPMEFAVPFCVEHLSRLMSEFGWTPSAAIHFVTKTGNAFLLVLAENIQTSVCVVIWGVT